MQLFEITTTTPEAQTSIGGKKSIWDSYKTTAKNFNEVLKKAQKRLDAKLKEEIRSITYLDEIR